MNTLESFFDQYPTLKVLKGEVILNQGDSPRYAYAIKSGYIKVCNITANGEEKILSFKSTNNLFPTSWVFSKTEHSLYFYCAHTDCVLYLVDKNDIETQVKQDVGFAMTLLNQHVNAHISGDLQIEALEQSRASLKLFYTLRHLSLIHGVPSKTNLITLAIPITQQDLANFTGLARETIVLELHALKKAGIVSIKNHFYTIDAIRLSGKIDDEFNPGIRQ